MVKAIKGEHMNVLLTSVGRRAYIVKYFQEALKGEGHVYVCNSDDLSVAFQYAYESVISPLIYSSDYIPFLLNYCKSKQIEILISLFDADLLILARHKKEFEKIGTKLIVSDEQFIVNCNDKWKTFLFLAENNIPAPKTYLTIKSIMEGLDAGEIDYPIIVKPRFGCGSIGLSVAENDIELQAFTEYVKREAMTSYLKYESSLESEIVIYQEFIQGQEYGVDVINDLEGNYVNTIIKKKIAMRAGETDIAETVNIPSIKQIAEQIAEISRHIGNLDMDVFLTKDGVPMVMELNARFGGGYPFSHAAGCNLPLAILKWSNGESVDKKLLEAKLGVRAFKELVIVEK